MKEFWNERYADEEFAYGTKANCFLKKQDFKPKSKILCIAEGEGRNALFLAKRGHDVTAIDFSEKGIEKINALAKAHCVKIDTICMDINEFVFLENEWDAIVAIFAHFPPVLRQKVHKSIYSSLKAKGKFILEAYTKEQLKYNTGGPKDETLLFSHFELDCDFSAFTRIIINEEIKQIQEGIYHNGLSSVIQIIASKE